MATSVGGSVRVQSQLGKGTSFHLHLPITLSVIRAVLVEIAGEPYAFPLNRIDRLLRVSPDSIGSLEHRQFLRVDGQNVGVVLGTQILRITKRPQSSSFEGSHSSSDSTSAADDLFIVLFSNHNDQYGMWSMAFWVSKTWWFAHWIIAWARFRTSVQQRCWTTAHRR